MNENCVESIPYASAIGFILMLFGCGVFSGTIWEGSDRLNKVFKDQFFQINEPSYMRNFGVIFAVVTLLIGVIILVYGAMLTGRTRRKIFDAEDKNSGSKFGAGFLLVCCYALLLGWLAATVLCMGAVAIYLMLASVCRHELGYWASVRTNKDQTPFTYQLNLSNYGIYPGDARAVSSVRSAGDMQQFCSEMSTIGPLFSVSFVCSVMVLLSLLTLISALAANLMRLKYLPELASFYRCGEDPHDQSMAPQPYPPSLSLTDLANSPPAYYGGQGNNSQGPLSSSSGYRHHANMEMTPLTAAPSTSLV